MGEVRIGRMILAMVILLAGVILFPPQIKAKTPAIKSDPNCSLSFGKEKARKIYKKVSTGQEVATAGDYGVYYQGKIKPKVTVLRDSILAVRYSLPADSGHWLTIRREFTGLKDLSNCSGIKFYWKVEETGEACLRFTICDLASADDFGQNLSYRTWNYDYSVYYLANTSGNWNESSVDFSKLKNDNSYGGRPATDGSAFNPGLVAAYEFSVYVPPETGREVSGMFFIKSVRTFR